MFLGKPFDETRPVGIIAGQIQLTVISCAAALGASERVRPTSTCFAAEYCGMAVRAYRPAAEAVMTILPPGTGVQRGVVREEA